MILLPEARDLGEKPAAELEAFARRGGQVVVFSESRLPQDLVEHVDDGALTAFWQHYRDDDRNRVLAAIAGRPVERIVASDPAAVVTRYRVGVQQVLHLLNYRYDETTDGITPIADLELRMPWSTRDASCSMLTLGGRRDLVAHVDDAELIIEVPELDPYAVLVVQP